jgi:hypothetical protein
MKRVLITIFAIILVAIMFSSCKDTNQDMNAFALTPQQILSWVSSYSSNGTINDCTTDKITKDGIYQRDCDIDVFKGDTVYNYLIDNVVALRIFANPANDVWNVTVSEAAGDGNGGSCLENISALVMGVVYPKLNPSQCIDEYNKLVSEGLPASDTFDGTAFTIYSYTGGANTLCYKFFASLSN